MHVNKVETTPFEGQKPGTSGLRKKVKVFEQAGYLENFVQSLFDSVPEAERHSLVIGGDGRYFNDKAIQTIVKMAIAAGYSQLYVGRDGYLSTPAVSNLIRGLEANGGIVLSASHNPAGPDEDFGIKYNNATGAPAPEAITNAIYAHSQTICAYEIADVADIDLQHCGSVQLGGCKVSVIDSVSAYVECMKSCFDFPRLKTAFAEQRLSIQFDAMSAITGPYAKAIFCDELGAPASSVMNGEPLSDFGGGHPDPNLAHAKDLVRHMYAPTAAMLGAASDGDGDRNMILGPHTFVTPGDSLAIITEHAQLIPQFRAGIRGVARSMPTSMAVDRVAKDLGIACYETPTGWKFFGNLLDAQQISICGEESFGTSGDHVREKDGLWAVLCWLSIMEALGQSVEEIVVAHWQKFGRSLYCRHDFEGIENARAEAMMDALFAWADAFVQGGDNADDLADIESADVFDYTDPIDGSQSHKQGVRVYLRDGSRIVYRLSGTGTAGATLRMYLEKYSQDEAEYRVSLDVAEASLGLATLGMQVARLEHFTGLNQATAVT
jgi:phosphoglucomutase